MDGTINSGLGSSSLINNQENVPTDMPIGQSDNEKSSPEPSSSQGLFWLGLNSQKVSGTIVLKKLITPQEMTKDGAGKMDLQAKGGAAKPDKLSSVLGPR